MTTIGPSFYFELRTAGVADAPISWDASGVIIADDIEPSLRARVQAVIDAHDPKRPAPNPAPDNPTNSDWQVGLLLWGRRDELLAKVEAERAKGTAIGKIADVRVNYANNVLREQLMQLKDVFGFTEAEIDESLWRAAQVEKGDLSGRWPVAS